MKMPAALLLVAIAALGGCTTARSPGWSLAGTAWQITQIDGQAPAKPDAAHVRFEGDRLSASVGCNAIGGKYRVDDNRLIAGPLISTRKFCDGEVGAQEQAVNALLAAAPIVSHDGDRLQLDSGGHTLDLRKKS
ncbi:META domain-containing protein [Novosphingobium sp. ZN18A2]|uniref:META domain-containing protein n=1 Tax=Novosphingobium sp. ZN18A2 TaxID=3079861 RepID=UPI0030D2E92A